MYLAGYIVAGFIVAAVYASALAEGPPRPLPPDRARRRAQRSRRSPRPCRSSWATGRAAQVAESQPVKLAAMEGLARTTEGAPFTFGGYFDESTEEMKYGFEVPYLLSMLAYHNPTATVEGLEIVPPEDRPPVNIVRFAFQTMVGIGTGLALLGTALHVHVVAEAPAATLAAGSTER